MARKPRKKEPTAGTVNRRLLRVIERFIDRWSVVSCADGCRQRETTAAVDLAKRIRALAQTHSMLAIDAYLRYLGWCVGDPDGLLYGELTWPTARMAFRSPEFTKLHHRYYDGFWPKLRCHLNQLSRNGPSDGNSGVDLDLACTWFSVDRAEVKRIGNDLCRRARRHVNENERLLVRACKSVGCPKLLVSLSGAPFCCRSSIDNPRDPEFSFPKMTGSILALTFPDGCGFEWEVTVRWGAMRDQLDRKRLQHSSQPV